MSGPRVEDSETDHSLRSSPECEDIGVNEDAAQDIPEQLPQNQDIQIDPQGLMVMFLSAMQNATNKPNIIASAQCNHAPPHNPQGNRPPGAVQQLRRCNTCGHTKHTVDECFIGHPDKAPPTYMGPRNEQKRALWIDNRIKLGMTTVPIQNNAVQTSTNAAAPQVTSYAVDASMVGRMYKQCFVKASDPGASKGIVCVESHARTMNHQEMPVSFELLEEPDVVFDESGQQGAAKSTDITTDTPVPVIAKPSVKLPDHVEEVIPIRSSSPPIRSMGNGSDAPVVTHDGKVTIQLTVAGNSDLSIDIKPKSSSHAAVPALSSAFVDHTRSIMKLRKCPTGLYYLTGTTPAQSITLRPYGSSPILPNKLLKDEGSNACLMDVTFAQEHNIAYSSSTAVVNTASGTPVDALGVTDPVEFVYAYGTEYETSVKVSCIVMARTGGLYDVLLGTNATQPVNAHVQPLFQRLTYLPRLQKFNDVDTVHHLPIKVVPSGHSAVISANLVQLPANTIGQAPYVQHTSKDPAVGSSIAMQQHDQQLQDCPGNRPMIKCAAELCAGVSNDMAGSTEEHVDGGHVEPQMSSGLSGYLPSLSRLGACVSQLARSQCKRLAQEGSISHWISQHFITACKPHATHFMYPPSAPSEAMPRVSTVTVQAIGVPTTQTNHASVASQEQPAHSKCNLCVFLPSARTQGALKACHLAAGTMQAYDKLTRSSQELAGGGQQISSSQHPSLAGPNQLSNLGECVLKLVQHQPVTLTKVIEPPQSLDSTSQVFTCAFSMCAILEPEGIGVVGLSSPVQNDHISALRTQYTSDNVACSDVSELCQQTKHAYFPTSVVPTSLGMKPVQAHYAQRVHMPHSEHG